MSVAKRWVGVVGAGWTAWMFTGAAGMPARVSQDMARTVGGEARCFRREAAEEMSDAERERRERLSAACS